jgi:molybdopterin molybdotransferase
MNLKRPTLLQLDEAMASLLAFAHNISEFEEASTFDADGRVLAQDLVSEIQVPPQDNSAMDGYAVRCADLAESDTILPVSQRIPAGSHGQPLAARSIARIFTGAPIPLGADAVVMQEDCEVLNTSEGGVMIKQRPKPGQWIRRGGEDVCKGAVVITKGERLTPAFLGLAASVGLGRLLVSRRPRVALFSTGDELCMPGEVAPQDMPPGAIYNSNRFFLSTLLRRLGCEVSDMGIVPDQRDATIQTIRHAAQDHDLILSSGGVSVGEEDHVKSAVMALGTLDLWQLAIKPGKPFAYGSISEQPPLPANASGRRCHFMGLPGNPVSSYVTFLLLVRPFILKLQGASKLEPKRFSLPAHFDWLQPDKRREFLRVKLNTSGGLELFHNQSSGVLTSVVWADGLVDNPGGKPIRRGELVQFLTLDELT